ncbi:hypothetical protein chiPu_0016685 [Chiloscyllium punctatum]|uniref:Uncharacterized protein n=1 Tax=Chiloscyllium punctatum TaxID=137246 RepID=A0A401T674_CHIPU|nr:hypothetical protein [Chiloscyllium punctatum]
MTFGMLRPLQLHLPPSLIAKDRLVNGRVIDGSSGPIGSGDRTSTYNRRRGVPGMAARDHRSRRHPGAGAGAALSRPLRLCCSRNGRAVIDK